MAVLSQERAHPGPSTAINGRHLLEGVALTADIPLIPDLKGCINMYQVQTLKVALTEDILKGVVVAVIGALEGLFDLAPLCSAVSSLRELRKVARCLAAHTSATQ